jgi:putative endonuclease
MKAPGMFYMNLCNCLQKYLLVYYVTMNNWTLYIIHCNDGSLYTGITNDLDNRISQHESGKGAKYTKGRGPFKVIYTEQHPDRSTASKRELKVKALTRPQKLALSNVV